VAKGYKSIRDGLTAATCALVGMGAAAKSVEATELDTSLLVYTERGGRISTFELMTKARQALGGGKFLDLHMTVDIMTGASANGATPADNIQTFTRPSGRGSYSVKPGKTPLDGTFQDNRGSVGVTFEVPVSRQTTARLGTLGSVEYDYVTFGANGTISRDFNKRNTTLTAGVAGSVDILDPEGDQPIPFAPMTPAGTLQNRVEDNEKKTVVDGLVGITQVVSRSTLMRLNYSVSLIDGYLTDPFKVISIVSAPPGTNQGEPLRYLFEHRPGARTKQSLYWKAKHHLTRDVVDLSYRYMWDDWDIASHTVDLKYRWQAGEYWSLQPQMRYYHQSAADFYVHSIRSDEALPGFASADYRLGEFDAVTAALKFSSRNRLDHVVNVRIGYYMQMGDSSPPDAIGSQQHHDLFPTVTAIIMQVGYSLTF
jgi:hypothetical protein